MEKTCYQELAEKIINGKSPKMFCSLLQEEYPKFALRGHSMQEFDAWMHIIYAVYELIMEYPELGLNEIKKIARKNLKFDVPCYRLTEKERDLIYQAERFGAGGRGKLFGYTDKSGNKNVVAYPCMHIPCQEGGRKDIFVVFSGHPESAAVAAQALYGYVKQHRQLPYGIMFLGLCDNQEMTDFSDKFKLRKQSEYRMYLRQMLALGVPKELLAKLLMRPNDTSTADNIQLIADTLRRYDVHNANLICVTYPVYQMRVATEVPFGLKNLGVCDAWVRIASIPVKPTKHAVEMMDSLSSFVERKFSYDMAEFQLADLSIGNCVAHLFREQGKARFALPWCKVGEYPEKFKPLLPLFLAYSYPNVAYELAKTDDVVASVLKIIRTLMLDVYDIGISGKMQDQQMLENTRMFGAMMVTKHLVTPEVLDKGCRMSCDEWLDRLSEFYDALEWSKN